MYKWMLPNIHSTYENNATAQNNRKGNLLSHLPVLRHSHSKDTTKTNSPNKNTELFLFKRKVIS